MFVFKAYANTITRGGINGNFGGQQINEESQWWASLLIQLHSSNKSQVPAS